MGYALLLLAVFGASYLLLRKPQSSPSPLPPTGQMPKIGQGDRLWLLGDSLGQGLEGHLAELAERSGVKLAADTKVGAPTKWGAGQAVLRLDDDNLWLVVLGANDAAGSGTGLSAHIGAILDAADQAAAEVVWAIAPDGGGLANYDAVMTEIVNECQHTILPPPGLPMAPDGVHLTPDGYATWAKHIWSQITQGS